MLCLQLILLLLLFLFLLHVYIYIYIHFRNAQLCIHYSSKTAIVPYDRCRRQTVSIVTTEWTDENDEAVDRRRWKEEGKGWNEKAKRVWNVK